MTLNSTNTVNGVATSKFDRTVIMSRAWEMFRQTYHYPQIKFASIGRKCFGWALRAAWAEAREAARIASIPAAAKSERIAALTGAIALEQFNECWPEARARVASMRAEISQLRGGEART